MAEQLKKLAFLIGEWTGRGEGFDSGKDTDIKNSIRFKYDPSPEVISGRFEATRSGTLENNGIMIILYDPNRGKFVRKTVYSYGFIMNEVGVANDDRFTFDCESIDALPSYWKGLRIREFLQKHSDNEFTMGLETAKEGESFRTYGQNRFRRS